MKLADWMGSQPLQDEWRKTWREPHMQEGLSLLRAMVCEANFVVPPGTDALTAGALRDAAREGFKSSLFLIEKMMEGPADPEQQLKPAYRLTPETEEPEPTR